MKGDGSWVEDRTATEVAVSMRALLAATNAGEMSCSAAYRNRLQGAVMAIESVAAGSPATPSHF